MSGTPVWSRRGAGPYQSHHHISIPPEQVATKRATYGTVLATMVRQLVPVHVRPGSLLGRHRVRFLILF